MNKYSYIMKSVRMRKEIKSVQNLPVGEYVCYFMSMFTI